MCEADDWGQTGTNNSAVTALCRLQEKKHSANLNRNNDSSRDSISSELRMKQAGLYLFNPTHSTTDALEQPTPSPDS